MLMPKDVLRLWVVGAENLGVASGENAWLVSFVGLGALVLLQDEWKLLGVLVEMDEYLIFGWYFLVCPR